MVTYSLMGGGANSDQTTLNPIINYMIIMNRLSYKQVHTLTNGIANWRENNTERRKEYTDPIIRWDFSPYVKQCL